jgi:hypothetical protein
MAVSSLGQSQLILLATILPMSDAPVSLGYEGLSLFAKNTVAVYMPTSSKREFPWLCILANTPYLPRFSFFASLVDV